MAYPTGIKVYIDGKDATYNIFGGPTLDPDPAVQTAWRDIDISTYLRKTPGIHTVKITSGAGAGRAEVRLEIR